MPHTRKKGQFMSATRLGTVSCTAKIIFLLHYLPFTQGNSIFIQYSAERPRPFSHTTGPSSAQLCSFMVFVITIWKTNWLWPSDSCVNRLVVTLTLIDMVGMGNGSRGRRWRVFRLLPEAFKFISTDRSSATKNVKSTRGVWTFFCYLLTFRLHFFTFVLLFSQLSVASFYFWVFFIRVL